MDHVIQQYGDEGIFALEVEQADVIKKENELYIAGEKSYLKKPAVIKATDGAITF